MTKDNERLVDQLAEAGRQIILQAQQRTGLEAQWWMPLGRELPECTPQDALQAARDRGYVVPDGATIAQIALGPVARAPDARLLRLPIDGREHDIIEVIDEDSAAVALGDGLACRPPKAARDHRCRELPTFDEVAACAAAVGSSVAERYGVDLANLRRAIPRDDAPTPPVPRRPLRRRGTRGARPRRRAGAAGDRPHVLRHKGRPARRHRRGPPVLVARGLTVLFGPDPRTSAHGGEPGIGARALKHERSRSACT